MKKAVCCVLVALSTNVYADTTAFDGNWVYLLRSQTAGQTAYADYWYESGSFERNGAKVSYWEKMVLADSTDDFKMVSAYHNVANCETQQSARIAFVSATGHGDVRLPSPSSMIESAPVYESFPPNSPGAKVLHLICRVKG